MKIHSEQRNEPGIVCVCVCVSLARCEYTLFVFFSSSPSLVPFSRCWWRWFVCCTNLEWKLLYWTAKKIKSVHDSRLWHTMRIRTAHTNRPNAANLPAFIFVKRRNDYKMIMSGTGKPNQSERRAKAERNRKTCEGMKSTQHNSVHVAFTKIK